MNWLTLRQYRTQAIAGYAAIAALAVLFLITGIQIFNTFVDSGLKACLARSGADCGELASYFSNRYNALQWVLPLVLIAPALIGMFWGAPLVARELENGTHRLAWTQSVTRRRWITSKLAIIIGSSVVASGVLALVMTWWSSTFITSRNWTRLEFGPFDLTGFVPVAYTVFAVAAGVALGALIRKTLPAMVATLGLFAAVRIPIAAVARKHFMAPISKLTPLDATEPYVTGSATGGLRDWVLRSELVDNTGGLIGPFGVTPQDMAARCPDLVGPDGFIDKVNAGKCFQRFGLQMSETIHPDSRFWSFQTIEAAIFLALAAALIAFVIWRVKRVS